jgi:hypothetical protein
MDVRLRTRPLKLLLMDDDPNIVEKTTRAAQPIAGRYDEWLEQRLGYLIGEQARLKGGPPLRRFLRGAMAAYRRFQATADPAHRFHCWATIQAVSAGLDRLEHGGVGHDVSGSAPGDSDLGLPLVAGLADRAH